MSRRDQARPHVEEAARHEAAGNYAEAAHAYRRALAADGEDLDAAHRLARCYEALREWSRAVEAWRHAVRIRSDQHEVVVGLAESLRQARCHHGALDAYERALELHPGHLFGLAGKGETLRMLGRYEQALAWFDAALEVHPEHAFALRGKASTLNALGRYDESLPLWAEALALEPRSAFALQGREETRRRMADSKGSPRPTATPPLPPARLEAERHAEWARALVADERHEDAILAFERALAQDPEWVEALNDLASAQEDAGRWGAACDTYRRVLELQPHRVDAACNVGEALRKADRYDEAIEAYDKALEVDPGYLYALAGRAEALRMLSRNEEALAGFDRALERKPTHPFALRGKAATLNALERYDEAIPLWQRSLDLDPGAEFAIAGLRTSEAGSRRTGTRRELADPARSRARAHFDVGRAYLQQGRTRDAVTALRKASDADAEWDEPWFLQGVALEEDRQYIQAVRAFDACLERKPEHVEAAVHKADALRKHADLDEAVGAYDKALELAAGDLRALAGRAEALRLLGRFDEALSWFDKVLDVQERHYFALCGKAATLNALHRYEEARPLWSAALEENPNSSFVLRGLSHCEEQSPASRRQGPVPGDRKAARDALERGRAMQKSGDLSAASDAYRAAADRDPSWAEPSLRLGMLLEDQRQYAQAIEAYERCLRLDPACFQAATNIGEAHRKNERYAEAIEAFDRSLAIRKDYLYALAGRAECMRMLGQYRDSLIWFDKALAQEPRHTFAIQGKAASLNALHRFAEALPLWNQALETDPHSQFGLDGRSYCEAQLKRTGSRPTAPAAPSTQDATEPGESTTPTLDEQGRDLTALARAGDLAEIVGRDSEIRAVMKTLVRRQKANPLLLGDPGVGKTAVVEGLANALIRDDVPNRLRDLRIIELSMGTLVAGTKYRGTFEDRLKKIVEEARENDGVVLFIDEIHTLVGAGRTEGGSLDAANILKPALARGEITVIGATTVAEFRKHVESDSALERRFQPVAIEEPSPEQALELLRKVVSRYTDHHEVEVDDAALRACVQLAVRFVPDRHLPDKALDLLDEACAEASLEGVPVVTSTVVAKVLSDRTGIPVGQLTAEEREKLAAIETHLSEQVRGQPDAVERLARTVRLCRSGLRDPRKPRGVFLFVGPSGVGKTELARQLSDYLFPEGNAFIRLDMSEYSDKFTMSRLIGAPPGYAGHGEPGQLTGKLRRRPYAVVLLDEFEKAHPEVQTLFLSLFDEGHVTDAEGREVDAREALFILTSNAGSEAAAKGRLGFGGGGSGLDVELLLERVKAHFRPELLNRIDEIVPFGQLTHEDLRGVVDLHLGHLAHRAEAEGVSLTWDEDVVELCAKHRADPAYGARPALRAIDALVGEPLGQILLQKRPEERKRLHATVTEGEVRFSECDLLDVAQDQDTLEEV